MTREELTARSHPVTESGCWIWEDSINGDGYGEYRIKGKAFKAHRFSYMEYKGPISNGMVIDHLCRVRCCVNPDHLEAVANRINVMRGVGTSAINASKTHCVRGHEFTKENTLWGTHHRSGLPTRRCRECNKAHCATYDKRRRENPHERTTP